MINIEIIHGEPVEELLRRLYVDEGLSNKDIADKLGIAYVSVIRWRTKAGIYTRKLGLE